MPPFLRNSPVYVFVLHVYFILSIVVSRERTNAGEECGGRGNGAQGLVLAWLSIPSPVLYRSRPGGLFFAVSIQEVETSQKSRPFSVQDP